MQQPRCHKDLMPELGQLPLAAGNPPIGVAPMMQQQAGGAPEAEVAAQQADILSRQS
jgi:hypothetical protein